MMAVTAIFGAALGFGGYTFQYAKGGSYLSNDPSACANCHVMGDHYAAWMKSSHKEVAGCNDCHTPPDSVVGKYATKAINGFLHSYAFTTGNYPDPLRIRGFNAEVTEKACRGCHSVSETIASGSHTGANAAEVDGSGDLSCLQCHRTVGHWVR